MCYLTEMLYIYTVPAIEIEHRKFTRSISPSCTSSFKFFSVTGVCMLIVFQKFWEKRPTGYEMREVLRKIVRTGFSRSLFFSPLEENWKVGEIHAEEASGT